MGDYKQLNRELIDANRELKQTIAAYQKELVLLRAELMEQQRMRVESERGFRERLLSFWAQNCLTFAREIDVNVNFVELLAHNSSVQTANSYVGISRQDDSTRSIRRSSQLVNEFRRSSAVCRPHSVIRMSPTRHHEDNAIAEETEPGTKYEQSGSDMDLDSSINGEDVIDVENAEDSEIDEDGPLHCIREDSEENCGEMGQLQRLGKTTRDLTNFDMETRDPKAHVTTRGKQQQRRNDSENSIQFARDVAHDCTQTPFRCTIERETEDELVDSMNRSLQVSRNVSDLNKLTQQTDAQNVVNPFQNENFHRHLVVRVERLHEPPHNELQFDNNNCKEHTTTPEEEHLVDGKRNDDLMLGITEFSMGNFLEASCSTPCHNRAARVEYAETTGTLSFDTLTQATCQSMRPSRRCAPRALAEPSLKSKLRNDSGSRISKKR